MPSPTLELIKKFPELPLEEVACYLCGNSKGETLVNDPPFTVILCAGCGLGYTTPRLIGERIHEIYGDEYFSSANAEAFGYSEYENDLEGYIKTFKRKLKVIGSHIPDGPVLEVGCAGGAFLQVMKELGHEVFGLELSPGMVQVAQERFGLKNIQNKLLSDAGFKDGTFGTIAMFDVIEHMSDPVVELERCRRLLKPGGVLILQTQNVDSRTRKLLGEKWHHFKQLEHIYHFSPKTLPILLERGGFGVEVLTRKHAGKFVTWDFVSERAHRVGGIPKFMCAPLKLVRRRFVYINTQDEMLVVAKPRED